MNGRLVWAVGAAAALTAGLALMAMAPAAPSIPPVAASADRPTVVELFQSQNCSSCPPANANLNAIADRPEVLALSFSITYFDSKAWKDTFSQPAFTQRQRDYAAGPLKSRVATPQMVINGRIDLIGQSRGQVERALRKAGAPGGPAVAVGADRVSIAAGATLAAPADVWLVRYDPRVQTVPIKGGENSGRTLPHKNVVRNLIRLGEWNGAAASFPLPASDDPAWRTAVLVQTAKGGPILGAGRR